MTKTKGGVGGGEGGEEVQESKEMVSVFPQ